MRVNLPGLPALAAAGLACLLGTGGLNAPLLAQAPRVAEALDQYLAGEHEAAVMRLAAVDDARKVRKAFISDAAWPAATTQCAADPATSGAESTSVLVPGL